jgi:hypothetical protein
MLDWLQRDGFVYFLNEANPTNGLVKPYALVAFQHRCRRMALATYPVGVEPRTPDAREAVREH